MYQYQKNHLLARLHPDPLWGSSQRWIWTGDPGMEKNTELIKRVEGRGREEDEGRNWAGW